MYEAVGIITRKVYASGSKADCFRFLNNKHPTLCYERNPKSGGARKCLYPEPLKILKKESKRNASFIKTRSISY